MEIKNNESTELRPEGNCRDCYGHDKQNGKAFATM